MHAQPSPASEIAAALAAQAEAVCRHYLPAGQRQGRYWIVGDIHGAPGRSLFVGIRGPRSGKWTDGATGDHGDLLDLIKHRTRSESLRETLAEARSFLALPAPPSRHPAPSPRDPSATIERLWRACRPIAGTHGEAYLHARGIRRCRFPSLRFHPNLYYRDDNLTGAFPALVAAVTDARGKLTGLHRTWLDHDSTTTRYSAPGRLFGRHRVEGEPFSEGAGTGGHRVDGVRRRSRGPGRTRLAAGGFVRHGADQRRHRQSVRTPAAWSPISIMWNSKDRTTPIPMRSGSSASPLRSSTGGHASSPPLRIFSNASSPAGRCRPDHTRARALPSSIPR